MIRIGLTGSIGMGKSTTAQMFCDEGIPVYDADQTVHDLYAGEAAELVEAEFPGTLINGQVNRAELGKRVLASSENLKRLEAIIHPLVHAVEEQFIEDAKNSGADAVLLDIPLLFETGGENRVDVIVVVTAPDEIQRERVLSRPGMTEEKFQAILDRQVPNSDKIKRADYTVDTSAGIDSARDQVRNIIKNIRQNLVQST